MIDYAQARLNMVDAQLRTNKVVDEAILDAFLAVPRELYVPSPLRGSAYVDDDIPLGGGRSMMEPLVLARLLQLAAIAPQDKVLEIGCGTGYATALLARLAGAVTALESDARLAAAARRLLTQQGVAAKIVEGDLAKGWPEGAPYDVILLNGAAAEIPQAISAQLAEGGRLVGVVRADAGPAGQANGAAVVMTRAEGALSSRRVFDAAAHELPGCGRAPSFVF